jgi:hypothetical protein
MWATMGNLTFGGRNPKGSHPFLVTLGMDMEFYQSTVAPEDTTTRAKYVPSEQCLNTCSVNFDVDLFALGLFIYFTHSDYEITRGDLIF